MEGVKMKRKMLRHALVAFVMTHALMGCRDADDTPNEPGQPTLGEPAPGGQAPTTPVQRIAKVVDGGEHFQRPSEAVVTPDGLRFYFSAYTAGSENEPMAGGIFSVAAEGGAVERVHVGAPLSHPRGLVMNCDGTGMYVTDYASEGFSADQDDIALSEFDDGGIYRMQFGQAPTKLEAPDIAWPTGLAFNDDCSVLYVTGFTTSGVGALFSIDVGSQSVTVVKAGPPLASPSGVYVDGSSVAWVVDHQTNGAGQGAGALYAITEAGETTLVAEDLRLGDPAGVSLLSSGNTALIPVRNEEETHEILVIDTQTRARSIVQADSIEGVAGIRSARNASVVALVDAEGNAIYRVE